MTRDNKIYQAICEGGLATYNGRATGSICQLARIAEVAHSTVRSACRVGSVRTYELPGAVLLADASDLADYFRFVKKGRKPINNIKK